MVDPRIVQVATQFQLYASYLLSCRNKLSYASLLCVVYVAIKMNHML